MARPKKTTASFLILILTLFFVIASPANAATGIFEQIPFQGKVVNTNGTNVTNGTYSFVFTIYDAASAGTQLWTETQNLTVTDGIFRASLGAANAFGTSIDWNTDNIYLAINFNSDGYMNSRVRLSTSPYALNAKRVAGLTVTDTTGTLTIPNLETISFGGSFSTTNGNDVAFTTSAATTLTLPTTGTLATLAGNENFTNKTIGSTGLIFSGATTDISTATGENLVLSAGTTSQSQLIQIGAGGVGSTAPDYLALDVMSATGDPAGGAEGYMYYNTFDNKFRCYQGSAWTDCIGTGGGASRLDQITAATTTASIANANNGITWNWGTLTTQSGMTFTGGTAMTTGSIFDLTTATYVHTAAETGELMNLAFTDSSTITSGTANTFGLRLAPNINVTSGAGTKNVYGLSVNSSQTSCSVGACNNFGVNVADVTDGTGFTGIGLQVGSGWDANVRIADTTANIQVTDTGSLTIENITGTDFVAFSAGSTVLTGNLLPAANVTYNLGTSGTGWSTIYTGAITFDDSFSNNFSIGTAAADGVTINNADYIQIRDESFNPYLAFASPNTNVTNTNVYVAVYPTLPGLNGGDTINLIQVAPTSGTYTGSNTINAMLIDNLTGTSASENALNIGTGWDNAITIAGGNFTMAGSGTFDTGTGAVSLDGNTTVASGMTFRIVGGAGDPTATTGIIWYDTTANKFKIVENGTVKILCNTTDLSCGAGGGATLNTITAATADGSVQDSNANTVSWNWDFTAAAVDSGLLISETTNSTSGTQDQQALVEITTLTNSTASPLQITSNSTDVGDVFINLVGAGDFQVRDNGTTFFEFTDAGGLLMTGSGALALNNDSITSDGALAIDAGGSVVMGGSGNTYTFSETTGPTYAGTARPARRATLAPEFAGALLTGDGSNNTGTMTSDFCAASAGAGGLPATNATVCNTSGDVHNYYSWTTASGTAQDYDIWVRWRVPDNFSAWDTNPVQVYGKRTDATNNAVTVFVYDTAHALNNAGGTQVAGTAWTQTNIALSGGTWTAGSYMTLRIVMNADTGGDSVQAGEINLNYLSSN